MSVRIEVNPLRGFRDIVGDEAKLLYKLQQIFINLAESHGYQPVIPPTLERFQLFAIKSGEEIRRSMYVFKDKAGREVALRPEATASIARIYLRLLRPKPKPVKLYYIVNCFRYEEPQKARYREFWQAGVEYLGHAGIEAEFDTIRLLLKFYENIGLLGSIELKIGTTKLYRRLFKLYGIEEEKQDHILHLMDKKMYSEALEYITSLGKHNLVDILEKIWKTPDNINNAKEAVNDDEEAKAALEELESLVHLLKDYMPKARISVDLSFARGLAYYTGIIYEVKTPLLPVSIAGGGRYDNLIELYGGESLPGTGFAIGLDRTLQAIKEARLEEELLAKNARERVAIVLLDPKHLTYAARVQDILTGRYNTNLITGQKLHKILPKLAEQGYKYAVLVGEKEAREETVTVRDLEKKTQKTVPLTALQEKPSLKELI